MARHNILGIKGEDMACSFLESKGYSILERNWRWRKLELDIIAMKDGELVIVEVKTRRNNCFGEPENAITDYKIRNIINAADVYVKKKRTDMPVRFDIISVTGQKEKEFEINHIEDAFSVW